MSDPHEIIIWKWCWGRMDLRLPRWLFDLARTVQRELSVRRRRAEELPVETTRACRRRSLRSQELRAIQQHERALMSAVFDLARRSAQPHGARPGQAAPALRLGRREAPWLTEPPSSTSSRAEVRIAGDVVRFLERRAA